MSQYTQNNQNNTKQYHNSCVCEILKIFQNISSAKLEVMTKVQSGGQCVARAAPSLRALTMTLALEGEPTWLKRQPQAG